MAARLVGLAKMAVMGTLMATPFLGMMIDSLNRSGECRDLKDCEGMGDCRVSSDDHGHQWYLSGFCGKVHLACARLSTHCREVL